MQRADIPLHCAAIGGVDIVIKKPVSTMRVKMLS